ncbi:ESF1 homolog [Bradysia coprophila]|uniref:ESF1 homolog n=1 Tax=Bradysia coprophila TaxID=38358 RepID=UPI00187D728D|nr:ESF1 homolog [Bradysia coprophila]
MKNKNKLDGSADDGNSQSDGIWQDQRFAHLVSDPRFKHIHKSTKKVKIDKRFESMFKDDKFKLKYTVDKYGRRQSKSKTGSEDLKKYYDLSSDEEDVEAEQKREEEEIAKDEDHKSLSKNDELQCDVTLPVALKDKLKDLSVDYARGQADLWSDDSSDDESSDEDEELFIEHVWGEMDAEAPTTEDSTRRLAACNMDWDRIRASDIMVLCNSFLPTGGAILSVTIYPSEFGKERIAEEEIKGPQELTEKKLDVDSDDEDASDGEAKEDENEEGSSYNMEKLRQYQLNRLKYYYAVIECNSVAAADKLYKECDGLEYESTATKLDLRFIPDEMTFDDEPKDVCTELPDMSKYTPRLFTTTALQQAKVVLTWDENNVERKELNEKLVSGKLDGVGDQELRKYVAYSSEDESEEEEKVVKKKRKMDDSTVGDSKTDSISKYKALLNDINAKEKQKKDSRIEMEFSWGIGVKNKPEKSDVDTADNKADINHFDKILELKKEKKKARKEEKKKLRKKHRNGGESDDVPESSDDDLPDGIDLNDPYFAEEFADGDFAEPAQRKSTTKGKGKKNTTADSNNDDEEQKAAELALLLDEGVEKKGHFSLKKIQDTENESKTKKRKKNRKKRDADADKALLDDDFKINTKDDRFSAVYSSHLYNIDPTDSNFKKTKGMLELIDEKLHRTASGDSSGSSNTVKPKKDVAVSMLVKSIKRKTAGKV